MTSPRNSLKSLGLAPSRGRGQNFLKDKTVAGRLASQIFSMALENRRVLEIGPGLGAVTRPLLDAGARVTAVELDRGLAEALSKWPEVENGTLTVLSRDILELDLKSEFGPEPLVVCGNLPYNLSTPILFWFMEQLEVARVGVFMLQREMVDRLLAKSGNREYGRLTVALTLHLDLSLAFRVSAGAFQPKPKVESSVIILTPKADRSKISFESLRRLTATAFHARRKTIFNNLRPVYGRELVLDVFEGLGIRPEQRPETLEPEVFAALAEKLEPEDRVL